MLSLTSHQCINLRAISVFNGGWNLPLWAGIDYNIFQSRGVNVSLTYTPNSVKIMEGFHNNTFPVVLLSADNIIAYQKNQAEFPINGNPDARIILSGDSGFLSIVGQSSIKQLSDLKGKVIGVDKNDTGFAFVLYEALEENGISINDVQIKELGGTAQRYTALMEGKCDATLLRTPYDIILKQDGFQVFTVNSTLTTKMYEGTVAAVKQSFLDGCKSNKYLVNNFYQAYRDALGWVVKNPKLSEGLVKKYLPDIPDELLAETTSTLIRGFDYYLEPNFEGIEQVYDLRVKFYQKFHNISVIDDDETKTALLKDMVVTYPFQIDSDEQNSGEC